MTSRNTDGVFRLGFSGSPATTENATQERKIQEFTPRFIGLLPSLNNTVLTLGVDVVASDYRLSSVIGDQVNDQSQRSLYAQAVVPATQSFDITLGVRYALVENELTDGFTFVNEKIEDDVTVGTLGISMRANNSWRVLARLDQNYRFVKVDEYTNAQPFPAVPNTIILKTQEGLSLEAGVEWTQNSNSAKLLVYKLDLKNEISYDPAVFANTNLDETQRKGIIASGHWKKTPRFGLSASYTYTDAEVESGQFSGKQIPLVAQHSAVLSTDYALSESWQVFAELFTISDRVFAGDFDNVLSKLPGYGVMNVKAEYNVRNFTFGGRINNIFNKQYSDVGQLGYDPNNFFAPGEAYFPSPEINFLLTAAWQFR